MKIQFPTVLVLVGVVILLTGCDNVNAKTVAKKPYVLPMNAKVEKDLGNGWMVFSIEGRQYIYRLRHEGLNSATETLAPF